ncbi:MAG: ATP-binding protein [Candidatus Aminicenantes bacterium]|nr:ATP-binding protein [Candidatus Aminicenantes bacterium]NIQ72614.1 ATP-binding protein [Candidatus Aminicenantes bacterium]NIT28648.1 ATP-binding protein [Candidatus Aminicenantes bacterium]
MPIKNITGQAVRGENFFKRPLLVHQLWRKVESGSSILIAAPRRIGKTSLLYHIHDNPKKGYYLIYLITESVNSEKEYYKKILNKILESSFLNTFRKFSKKANQVLRDRIMRITEIGKTVKFDSESQIDYREEFIHLIKSLDLKGERIIFMIDEFPQTLENIIEDDDSRTAIHFLQGNREIRQDPEINNKLQFIYTGSIGLENIVNRLNSIHLINDLDTLRVPPLTKAESHELMQRILETMPFELSKTMREFILDKIEWLTPFYIQLALQEICHRHDEIEVRKVTKKMIDQAFREMLELRGFFEHWHTRLRKAYKRDEYKFAKELLNYISNNEKTTSEEIRNLSQKFDLNDFYKDIVNSLIYDGYINNEIESHVYCFNSPLLKLWWRKNVAN